MDKKLIALSVTGACSPSHSPRSLRERDHLWHVNADFERVEAQDTTRDGSSNSLVRARLQLPPHSQSSTPQPGLEQLLQYRVPQH
jgi:hypothetical protein